MVIPPHCELKSPLYHSQNVEGFQIRIKSDSIKAKVFKADLFTAWEIFPSIDKFGAYQHPKGRSDGKSQSFS